MLARLLQFTVIGVLVFSFAWLGLLWKKSMVLAILGFIACLFVQVPFLALEFLLARRINRTDSSPPARLILWIRAWWTEVRLIYRVFAWRQPFQWSRYPDRVDNAFSQRGRRGVLFIHGFICNRGLWNPWLSQIRKSRKATIALNLQPLFGSIDRYSNQIDRAVHKLTQATGMPPLVICHSMGGLAVRAWLRSAPNTIARIHHIVTIGSPHHGTWLGRFSTTTNGRQMRLQNRWILELAATESPAIYAKFTCYYSNCDNIVFPASTAMLPGADNRHISGVAHVALAYDQSVMTESLAMM
jgi:triacylglycerol lipase